MEKAYLGFVDYLIGGWRYATKHGDKHVVSMDFLLGGKTFALDYDLFFGTIDKMLKYEEGLDIDDLDENMTKGLMEYRQRMEAEKKAASNVKTCPFIFQENLVNLQSTNYKS